MLDHPAETATKSIYELAKENNINISSITRLAEKLGTVNFSDLKNVFKQQLNQKKNYYSSQVEKHLPKGLKEKFYVSQTLQYFIQNKMVKCYDDGGSF